MSSTPRENARSTGDASSRGIVRWMVNLPRSIAHEFSRATDHGMEIMGIGNRRRPNQVPTNFSMNNAQEHLHSPEEWAFLTNFERQYGSVHPFFYACRLTEALKIAEAEKKFLFLYLHSPEHPFTPLFCKETLCSDVVVQFLDTNFVSWAALADSGEGVRMAATLNPQSFPFCAVIASAPGDTIAILQQMEGPISQAELIEILQRTVDEHGMAFGIAAARAKRERKIKADRQLREEQDSAYMAALQMDKEKEKMKPLGTPNRIASEEMSRKNQSYQQTPKSNKLPVGLTGDQKLTQILIRFPNGERRERSFPCTEKIHSVYRFIDSLGIPSISNYRLVSTFPRKVYGADKMGMTLKDAGLYPRASLFLEPC